MKRSATRAQPAQWATARGRIAAWTAVGAGLLAVAAYLAFGASAVVRESYPIAFVRVEGPLRHLDGEALRKGVAPLATTGYFALDLEQIAATVGRFPWVANVTVRRQWPDTLILRIREHDAVARWNEHNLLTARGESFAPPKIDGFVKLPKLSGIAGQEQEALSMLRQLNLRLTPWKMRVTALRMNGRRAWTARLSDGKELVFGRQDPVAGLERLLHLLPQIGKERIAEIQQIDLRYPNGFAVDWRVETEGFNPPKPDTTTDRKPAEGRAGQAPASQLASNP